MLKILLIFPKLGNNRDNQQRASYTKENIHEYFVTLHCTMERTPFGAESERVNKIIVGQKHCQQKVFSSLSRCPENYHTYNLHRSVVVGALLPHYRVC